MVNSADVGMTAVPGGVITDMPGSGSHDLALDKFKAMKAQSAGRFERALGAGEVHHDENGIPFHSVQGQKAQPLVGIVDGTLRYPLWTGKLVRLPDGSGMPKICMVPVSEAINNGSGVDYYKKQKGFKEVSEIPDSYEKFRDPYVDALAVWRKKEQDAEAMREMLAAAGVQVPGRGLTTTKTMRGI